MTEQAKGKSYTVIASEIDISKTTPIKWSKELEVEIGNLVAIERKALYEQYKVGKEHLIWLLRYTLHSVADELESRKLYNTDRTSDHASKSAQHVAEGRRVFASSQPEDY